MAEMPSHTLSPLSGEFLLPEREAAFQAERFPETLRHLSHVLLASALLNAIFLVGDLRFWGETYFHVRVPAHLLLVLLALACLSGIRRSARFGQAQGAVVTWEWLNAVGVAVLLGPQGDIALLSVLMLPAIYYLVVPTSFRWSVASGVGCSIMMLAGYVAWGRSGETTMGLILAVVTLNLAMVLVLARANRLQRLGWSATQAERRAKEDLANSRAMFETMFKTVPLPLVVVQESGFIVEHNDAAIRYFGSTPEALGIQKIGEIYVNPNDRDAFMGLLARDGQVTNFETQIRLADGSIRTVLLVGRAMDIGGVQHIMAGAVDITERKAAEERVWRAASHDPVTNLPNRAYFQSRLEQVAAQSERNGTSVALLLLGLDNLSTIIDALGYEASDALLRDVASRLSEVAKDCDTVARLEGDEFVIVLVNDVDPAYVKTLAEQALAELRQPFSYGDKAVFIQPRIGIAAYPGHGKQPSDLMTDADVALKAARSTGSTGPILYTPDLQQGVEQKRTAAQDIQEAMRKGQIVPFYQPKVDVKTGKVTGFEALARWHHPTHGLLTPAHFMAAFEDAELSIAFGEYMVRQVAKDIRAWLNAGIDCGRIAVNLSTAQFSWIGLAKRLLDILRTADVPNNRLEVEITETVFLGRSAPHVVTVLKQFHENGIKIALDDFGTGYASLIHLKQFPIDSIKIDRSFVKDLKSDAGSEAIVVAITKLGMSLGMDVVAEGVETAEQATFLQSNGCTQVQGYLYAKPMAAGHVAQFLNQQDMPSAARH